MHAILCFLLRYIASYHAYFNSESEYAWLISIHSTSSYDLKLFTTDFLSGKLSTGCQVELVDMTRRLVVLGRLENELRRIRRRIDNEENPARKAKMINVYRKMSRALTGKEP